MGKTRDLFKKTIDTNGRFHASLVQFSWSFVSASLWPHGLQHARLFITNSWSLLKLMSIRSVIPSNHLILCCPILLLPSIFPRISFLFFFFYWPVLHIRWPKCCNFSISPSNEYKWLISFRINWFDILVVHSKMSTIKHRNGMHITEVEDIKKRWQECTEELYKKDLSELDNHHVIISPKARHTGVWSQVGLRKHH